ncbi:hypothetical protein AAFF_G00105470 [Aldrovandia affinis]|uniref:Uncharacterized protein n=1 Tax=Aldrovandia affinis TaxID=143900 RepID=A0AAD7WXT1_9TELE|nr:hypothetical protein AAFF_G00105470 [Aldrovandia affinis]
MECKRSGARQRGQSGDGRSLWLPRRRGEEGSPSPSAAEAEAAGTVHDPRPKPLLTVPEPRPGKHRTNAGTAQTKAPPASPAAKRTQRCGPALLHLERGRTPPARFWRWACD